VGCVEQGPKGRPSRTDIPRLTRAGVPSEVMGGSSDRPLPSPPGGDLESAVISSPAVGFLLI